MPCNAVLSCALTHYQVLRLVLRLLLLLLMLPAANRGVRSIGDRGQQPRAETRDATHQIVSTLLIQSYFRCTDAHAFTSRVLRKFITLLWCCVHHHQQQQQHITQQTPLYAAVAHTVACFTCAFTLPTNSNHKDRIYAPHVYPASLSLPGAMLRFFASKSLLCLILVVLVGMRAVCV